MQADRYKRAMETSQASSRENVKHYQKFLGSLSNFFNSTEHAV